MRHASCSDAAGHEVHISMCNLADKRDHQKCNEQICTNWKFGPWSQCSVTCGDGTEIRDAICIDKEGRQLKQGIDIFNF